MEPVSDQGSSKPRSKAKAFIRRLIAIGLLAILGLVGSRYLMRDYDITWVSGLPVIKSKKKIAEKAPEQIPMPVKVYKVAKVNFQDKLPSLGTVKGFRQYELKFPVSGNIEYINFKEGERITQGDIIASLDQKEQLLKLEYAKIDMEKQTKLFELGSIIETKLKQSQLEYQSAKVELDKTNLVAPSDGYVAAMEYEKNAYVTPGDKIAVFVDYKDVFVEFGVIEKDIAKVKLEQNVEFVFDTFPDQVFKGQVDSISPLVEGRSRTAKIRSKLSNPDERIRPGMFGRVSVLVYEKEDAIVIPNAAFKKKNDQYVVYLVHPEEQKAEDAAEAQDAEAKVEKKQKKKGANEKEEQAPPPEEPKAAYGTVEVRPIEIGHASPDAIEIKEGLEEGDLIIVDVEQDMQDKARVEISETQEGIF